MYEERLFDGNVKGYPVALECSNSVPSLSGIQYGVQSAPAANHMAHPSEVSELKEILKLQQLSQLTQTIAASLPT